MCVHFQFFSNESWVCVLVTPGYFRTTWVNCWARWTNTSRHSPVGAKDHRHQDFQLNCWEENAKLSASQIGCLCLPFTTVRKVPVSKMTKWRLRTIYRLTIITHSFETNFLQFFCSCWTPWAFCFCEPNCPKIKKAWPLVGLRSSYLFLSLENPELG